MKNLDNEKLLVAVLGHSNAGKSTIWNILFGAKVKTGKYERQLFLNNDEFVNVFLISGSPEERGKDIANLIPEGIDPRIVLCSFQYPEADYEDRSLEVWQSLRNTIQYFKDNEFKMYVTWINPGKHDAGEYHDDCGIQNLILQNRNSVFGIRPNTTQKSPKPIVQDIKDYLYGWAKYRNCICQ